MNQRADHLHRHLSQNESECFKRNITVQVDRINAEQNVAYCSVEQRLTGFLRRTYSVTELIWRAEQALAPLNGLGIVPLLTVRHKSRTAATASEISRHDRSPMDWIPDLYRWLGSPFAREGFRAIPVVSDPFGWKQALRSSGVK